MNTDSCQLAKHWCAGPGAAEADGVKESVLY